MLRADQVTEKRGKAIKLLEEALALADEMKDGMTGFLIKNALTELRSHHGHRSR